MDSALWIAGTLFIVALYALWYLVTPKRPPSARIGQKSATTRTGGKNNLLQESLAVKGAIQKQEQEIALLQMKMKSQTRYQALAKWAQKHPSAVTAVLRKWMGEGEKKRK
jgi:flagellar biosynthesis/type III secretory pathway M-ring protein FliF/YscJ